MFADIASLLLTGSFLLMLTLYVYYDTTKNQAVVSYQESHVEDARAPSVMKGSSLPFASKQGKTYTFSWCQGAERISEKNKVFFSSEEAAQQSGRRLSKLCEK